MVAGPLLMWSCEAGMAGRQAEVVGLVGVQGQGALGWWWGQRGCVGARVLAMGRGQCVGSTCSDASATPILHCVRLGLQCPTRSAGVGQQVVPAAAIRACGAWAH
jgi:hypothetical protein